MIDQDGVVTDRNYRVTCDISGTLLEIEKAGYIIVPNSDTPLVRLQNNFNVLLGIQPDHAVAEYGAVVQVGREKVFTSNVQGIPEYRKSVQQAFLNSGWDVAIGDSATWVRDRKKFEPNRKLLIVDGMREQSVGMYFKRTNHEGLPQTSEEIGAEGMAILGEISMPSGCLPFVYNPPYGIAISNVQGVSKTAGYRVLRARYPDASFFMIGDQQMDFIEDPSVTVCAVGNASPELKTRSRFVACGEITRGLDECLWWILGNV